MEENSHGVYQHSVVTLNECFQELISSIIAYQNHKKFSSLDSGIFTLWTSSKGVQNLVKILSLGYDTKKLKKFSQSENKEQNQEIKSISCELKQIKQEVKAENSCSSQFDPQIRDKYPAQFSSQRQKHIKQYIRGPYKNYTAEEKVQAVNLLRQNNVSVSHISRRLNIPCKNIKRWAIDGIQRKKGGGRKRFNPEMEDQIHQKLCSLPTREIKLQTIQTIALELSDDQKFKASRGWIIKFIQRYNIRQKFTIC